MGVDLGTLLSTMGTVWVGNPLSLNPGFSIGGTTSASSNILGNLFGLTGNLPVNGNLSPLVTFGRDSARTYWVSQLDRV